MTVNLFQCVLAPVRYTTPYTNILSDMNLLDSLEIFQSQNHFSKFNEIFVDKISISCIDLYPTIIHQDDWVRLSRWNDSIFHQQNLRLFRYWTGFSNSLNKRQLIFKCVADCGNRTLGELMCNPNKRNLHI